MSSSRMYPEGPAPFYSKWNAGVLEFYRRSDHTKFWSIDGANAKVIVASGGSFENLGTEAAGTTTLADGEFQYFGTGTDVSMSWTGSIFEVLPVADDTGSFNIGDGATDFDFKWFGGTTAKYVLFDVGNVLLQLEDVDLKLGDNDEIQFGDAAGGDVSILWNASLLQISPAVDDTGSINIGDGTADIDFKVFLGAAGDSFAFDVGNKALQLAGEARIDLSSATVAAANTDGGVIKGGTSGARIVEDTAGMKFMSFYFDDGATSGTAIGNYTRLYVTGAGGSGQAARFFTTVEDVAAAGASGAHISCSFGSTGSITGGGNALTTTLHVPGAMTGGTYASQFVEIWADAATSDLAGVTDQGFLRVGIGGDATGIALLDDTINFATFYGVTAGSGNMIDTDKTTHTAYGGLRVDIPGVGIRWIALVSA